MIGPQKTQHLVLIPALLSGIFQTDRNTADSRSVLSTSVLPQHCQRLSLHFLFLPSTKSTLPTLHTLRNHKTSSVWLNNYSLVLSSKYTSIGTRVPKTLCTPQLCTSLLNPCTQISMRFWVLTCYNQWKMTRLESWPNTPKPGSWGSEFNAGRGK